MIHYNIVIKGKVSGVIFRNFLKRKAQNLKISGFAKIQKDKSVYAEIEAKEEILQRFIDDCHITPPRTKVDSIDIVAGKIRFFENFEIKN
ncbi:MAG: acylphosphatase [Cytophagales bacterium]|nr:MAG: acylphosphatase [Cytophagales bacterium]